MQTITKYMIGALFAAVLVIALPIIAGTTHFGNIIAQDSSVPSCSNHQDNGDICADEDILAEDDITVGDDLVVIDDAAIGGNLEVTGNLEITGNPTFLVETLRFCGNGHDGATAHYMGPVPLDDTEADLVTGGAGCDALDDATIGNVDAAWDRSPNVAFSVVAMQCNGICTGATAANDPVVLTFYDDTVATSVTCTFTFAGDATANQCTVNMSTAASVAAGSLLAVKVAGTDDVCDDAGDDFECILSVTY